MKILFLGPNYEKLKKTLQGFGDKILNTEAILDPTDKIFDGIDLIISYGYRHIISEEVVRRFRNKIINLHISLLPWNRGADPNLWSFLEDTPKGVSIHYIDEGIDTGPILFQKELHFSNEETLASTYQKLTIEIEKLFSEKWPQIRTGKLTGIKTALSGSYHRMADSQKYKKLLNKGWETKVSEIMGKAKKQ